MNRTVEKNALSLIVEELFEKFLHPDSDTIDLPKFEQFFLVQRCISGEIFTKIRSLAFLHKVADRQTKKTDRQTNKRR